MLMSNELYEKTGMIQDEFIKNFVLDVLNSIDTNVYHQTVPHYGTGDLAHYTNNVVGQIIKMLPLFNLSEEINDVFISSALLHAVYMYEEGIDGWHSSDEAKIGYIYNPLYQLAPRVRMQRFASLIDLNTYNDICTTIELQGGNGSMYPQFNLSLEDNVIMWLLPLAIYLAKTE